MEMSQFKTGMRVSHKHKGRHGGNAYIIPNCKATVVSSKLVESGFSWFDEPSFIELVSIKYDNGEISTGIHSRMLIKE